MPMSVPKVVIVGRPNVGKSSILNWLARKRISVVEPTAGVTRDRVTYLMHEGDRYFELVDTGGIGIVDSDVYSRTTILRQATSYRPRRDCQIVCVSRSGSH